MLHTSYNRRKEPHLYWYEQAPARKKTITTGILIYLLILVILTMSYKAEAQDVDFSQHYSNPTYYNPAYVGLSTGLKARLNIRKRWTGLEGRYNTYNFSVDMAERSLPGAGGLGLLATQDVQGAGLFKTNTVGIMPAVRIPVSRSSIIQIGALAAIVTKQLNFEKLVFTDQLDPHYGNIYPSAFEATLRDKVIFPDFSFGGIYQFQGRDVEGIIGTAVHHLTEPNQSFFDIKAPLTRKYVYHMDFIISLQDDRNFYERRTEIKLNPGMMVQYQNGLFVYTAGMNIYFSHVYLGLWYRNEALEYDTYSNFSFMGGINIYFNETSRMKFIYTYDYNIMARHNFTGPSHEISLIFEFDDISFWNKDRNSLGAGYRRNAPIECSPF